MLTKYIGLISQTDKVPMTHLLKIAAAVQKQFTRDFLPLWNIPATIQAFQSVDDIPLDYWPIIIMDDIAYPGAAGIHLDRNGQPYALVRAEGIISLTVSHEALEMVVDPFGNRFVAGESVKKGQGRVNYLVEICDPSEDEAFAYQINGVLVSDFYTPHYMDPLAVPGVRYSYSGAITKPREVLKGGYLSWMLPESGEWWQATFFEAEEVISSVGKLEKGARSWREVIDSVTDPNLLKRNRLAPDVKSRISITGKAKQISADIFVLLSAANGAYLKDPEHIKFLSSLSVADHSYDPLQVIRIILNVAGYFTLSENTPQIALFNLVNNLRYNSTTYASLFGLLFNYVKKIDEEKELDQDNLTNCVTVGNVTDLVEATLKR